MTSKRNLIARRIHRNMCEDDRFGYSWDERWGANPEEWTVGGLTFSINVGDYDCSSSCITAWKLALTNTPYEHALDGATYTGNMREVFCGSGLFEWEPISFIASPGDLYLNEANHVAMCQQQSPDELTEFSINEDGDVHGGKRGDQTGNEAHVAGYYDYPWDGILHYTGRANRDPKAGSRGYRLKVARGIYSGNTSKSTKKASVAKGGYVDYLDKKKGRWRYVETEDGVKGWMCITRYGVKCAKWLGSA